MTIDELIERLKELDQHDGMRICVGVTPTRNAHIRFVEVIQESNGVMGAIPFVKIFI